MQSKPWREVKAWAVWAAFAAWLLGAPPAEAVRERKEANPAANTPGAMEARRLLDRGRELMEAKETERGVRVLESILEQYPGTPYVYPAALELGRYYMGIRDQTKAIPLLGRLKAMAQGERKLQGEELEWYLEALYLTGKAHFEMHRFGDAFSVLRKITSEYSGTVWANQAYYYIGMCHFAEGHWSKAIENLNNVGTYFDPNLPASEYVEAGRRLYVRIEDRDLPLLARLGKKPRVFVQTSRGDREELEMTPLTTDGKMMGSITTEVGLPKPGDRVLQVLSGDTITTTYIDESAESGDENVSRTNELKVVSTGSIGFTMGDYETAGTAVYQDDWCFLRLWDADLDVTDAADGTDITVISRYKKVSETTEDVLGHQEQMSAVEYVTRDQVRVHLTEFGTNDIVHTGIFRGKCRIVALPQGETPNPDDNVLSCREGDEVVATYTDALSIDGPVPRTISVSLPVLGPVDSRPQPVQQYVADIVTLAKKNVVEATAYLELAKIFRSMGLLKGAKDKVQMGLERTEVIIKNADRIPDSLLQDAFKVTWELYIVADEFGKAMGVCGFFNQRFPNSPIVDQALMGMGTAHMQNKNYKDAITMFNQVLALRSSESKGEAQYHIGEAMEQEAEEKFRKNPSAAGGENPSARRAPAIPAYRMCEERYPQSPFAPLAINKIIDYYIVGIRDYPQAVALLEKVFVDYPDAPFLDQMLLFWAVAANKMGDNAKAREKCERLISDYPDSRFAPAAKKILASLSASSGGGEEGGS